jgi:hypothetical protein
MRPQIVLERSEVLKRMLGVISFFTWFYGVYILQNDTIMIQQIDKPPIYTGGLSKN